MMKSVLLFLLTITFLNVDAQKTMVTVSAGNKTISASTEDKNDDKILLINTSQNGYLSVIVSNDDSAWKRSFFIVDDAGNDIVTPVMMKENEYCSRLNNLFKNFQILKDYYLYTISLPKDPKQAMLVKVPRKLICKIRLEN